MTTKYTPHLINNPTQENTHFIHTANNKPIKEHLFGKRTSQTHTTIITTFNDLIKTRNIQREIQEETRYGNPISKTLHKMLNSTTLAPVLTFLGLALIFLAYIKALSFIIPITEKNFLFMILSLLAATGTTIYVTGYVIGFGDYMYDQKKYHNTLPYLSRKQKACLKTISVACVNNEKLKAYNDSLYRVQYAANSMLQLREDNREYNIDTSRFARAYDDYAQVLVFVYVNKNSISEDLFEKYVKELEALTEIVVEEARIARNQVNEINQAISTELEKSKTLEKEIATIRQEEVDTAAAAAMPLRFQ